ncbi:uncharacterized protein LOC113790505 [Dermatophagoides pteronyssinus]|uniref:uncharacterized protein LOC113790505 n=1 Tax=Dermatophagoides pteronyssinus TaxID=6956 RepID=UPI003F67CB48
MGGQCSIVPNQEPEYQILMVPPQNNQDKKRRRSRSGSRIDRLQQQQYVPIYGYSGYPIVQGYPNQNPFMPPPPIPEFSTLPPPPPGFLNPYNPYRPQPPPPPFIPGMMQNHPQGYPVYKQTSKHFCSPELYESMVQLIAAEMKMKEKQQQQQFDSMNNFYNQTTTSSNFQQQSTARSKSKSKSKSKSRQRRGTKVLTTTTLSDTFSPRKPIYDSKNSRDQTPKELAQKIQQLLNDNKQHQNSKLNEKSKQRRRRNRKHGSKSASSSMSDKKEKSKKFRKKLDKSSKKESKDGTEKEEIEMKTTVKGAGNVDEPFEIKITDDDDLSTFIIRPKINKLQPEMQLIKEKSSSRKSLVIKQILITPTFVPKSISPPKSTAPSTPKSDNQQQQQESFSTSNSLPIYGYSGGFPVISGFMLGLISGGEKMIVKSNDPKQEQQQQQESIGKNNPKQEQQQQESIGKNNQKQQQQQQQKQQQESNGKTNKKIDNFQKSFKSPIEKISMKSKSNPNDDNDNDNSIRLTTKNQQNLNQKKK